MNLTISRESDRNRVISPGPPELPPKEDLPDSWNPKCFYCRGTDGPLGSGLTSFRPKRRVLAHKGCYRLHQWAVVGDEILKRAVPISVIIAVLMVCGADLAMFFLPCIVALAFVLTYSLTAVYFWKYIPPEKLN